MRIDHQLTLQADRGFRYLRCSAIAGALLAVAFATAPSLAAEPKWPDGPYRYITLNQSVGDALTEFGRNIGVPVHVSASVKGRVGPGLQSGSAREFLETLSSRYGLIWYYDGASINVSPESETRTELLKLDKDTFPEVVARLDRLGIKDERFPVRVSETDQLVSVSGPPSYINLVKKTLGVVSGDVANASPKDAAAVRVFRGRRAEQQQFSTSKTE